MSELFTEKMQFQWKIVNFINIQRSITGVNVNAHYGSKKTRNERQIGRRQAGENVISFNAR